MSDKKKIALIKKNCITLRANNQIPLELVSRILKIDNSTNQEYIGKLMYCADMYMRVKGFYKKYPQLAAQYNKEIIKILDN